MYSRLKNQITIEKVQYFEFLNASKLRNRNIYIVPLSVLLLLIILISFTEITMNNIILAFIVVPVFPIVYNWLTNLIFYKFSYGILFMDESISNGFGNSKIKYLKIEKLEIKGEKLQIKTSNEKLNFLFSIQDLERIEKIFNSKNIYR